MSSALVAQFYEAWNAGRPKAIAELFGEKGEYSDPLSGGLLRGAALTEHISRFLGAIPDRRFSVERTLGDSRVQASEWELTGTCRGALSPELPAVDVTIRLRGVDILDVEGEHLVSVRRIFDSRALADALGLQTIIEPIAQGSMTFGYSVRDWASKVAPGLLGMTWIAARDEAERAVIRQHARDILTNFHEVPGFIGAVTGFTGLHGFTLTAWENEDALRGGIHGSAHGEAMRQFHAGLSGGVFTSVWRPHRINRMWTRCASCGFANDATRADGRCEQCHALLPERAPYI
ncbi:MAG TPA: nuclear transport factor 2 family protein [Polyangiaceae bacterium]|nr:nuclear transport factor 2 family protein [Polyangiaceae bacterium]